MEWFKSALRPPSLRNSVIDRGTQEVGLRHVSARSLDAILGPSLNEERQLFVIFFGTCHPALDSGCVTASRINHIH